MITITAEERAEIIKQIPVTGSMAISGSVDVAKPMPAQSWTKQKTKAKRNQSIGTTKY